jgi:hypothetical protein
MINELVGKALVLFDPEASALRERKEADVRTIAQQMGYSQVYTPFICKRETLTKFGMEPPFESIVIKPENPTKADESRYEECKSYAYLMPKHANHVVIGGTRSASILSYKDLPVRLYELSDIYFLESSLTNRAGAYFTALVLPEALEQEKELMGKFYKSHHTIDSISFVNKDNKEIHPIAVCGHFFLEE